MEEGFKFLEKTKKDVVKNKIYFLIKSQGKMMKKDIEKILLLEGFSKSIITSVLKELLDYGDLMQLRYGEYRIYNKEIYDKGVYPLD